MVCCSGMEGINSAMYRRIYRKLIRALVRRLIGRASLDEGTFWVCKAYVDRFNGENNDDMTTNGELTLLERVLSRNTCYMRANTSLTVFDVGANVGDWARFVLSINPSIVLHCFEPSHYTFERLKSSDWPEECFLNNYGLGSKSEERVLYVFEPGSGMNSLYQRHGLEDRGQRPQRQSEAILLRTLDEYCVEKGIDRIDFMKVDVEGHELEVFRGARRAFEEGAISAVQFEYGGCNIDSRVLLLDLFTFLADYGYRVFKLFPDGPRLLERYSQSLENFQYANYLALASDFELETQVGQ